MKMTQQDYDDRKARADKGEGSDEDTRLVKLYEREGYTATPASPQDAHEGAEGADEAKYERLSDDQILKEVEDRQLDADGDREQLIARLVEHDAKGEA